uniref:Pyrokinin n=14 Tax=Neoptera TaxID=33340 RepID=PPK_RHOPR|nr:RecName: Full=Pyrokinin-2; Short=PK-2; AltName: Full=FXPRL-amide [Namaquaphasma ookiepense]B0M3B7.1 RecName: Full=Pyrokinin-2; Short=PK-2; AltName: Full=FXPRL-amide [Striatophasma naukluftense]B0M3D9.1 RecName: Full=Pyrokinin-2; Short=PK-2; AltName: Full=FXPRL-amide [Mantophasma kudubergense]B3A054.1 RecName: Full=Pyrokinin-2; Short=PK-2; AltName: Full=FXPRL-amide [Karoophasma botterkloofense]B3A073.1 RecName: Full=Pyrokinin-2; Short=PK-2; AltName: Full=FXPRL-amide [Karoophasma biedouwense]
SPPFAPRL